jgi:AraC-like DNA-binding protein
MGGGNFKLFVGFYKFILHIYTYHQNGLFSSSGLNLTEISWKLNYSSVAHLSSQFKKVTGVTPSHFKNRDAV